MKVNVLIAGVGAKSIDDVPEGTTLSEFVRTYSGTIRALDKIDTFYVNQQVARGDTVLTDGNIVQGTPKAEGGI